MLEQEGEGEDDRLLIFTKRLMNFNAQFGEEDLSQKLNQTFADEFSKYEQAYASYTSTQIPTFYPTKINERSSRLRVALREAAKTEQVAARLHELEKWEADVMRKLWEMLSAASGGSRGTSMDYETYKRVVKEFEDWREVYRATSDGAKPSPAPPGLHGAEVAGVALPSLDASLFLSVPRMLNGKVESKNVYTALLRRISLFKAQTELLMRDDDNDGCLGEDEIEAYISELIPSMEVFEKVEKEFLPFCSCSATRRIFWILDPYSTGRIKIDDLLRCPVMEDWLEIQLALEDIPRSWFGNGISHALYEKFLELDRSCSGMLTRDDMKRYKKGIPTVSDDGLPAGVSPLSSLFIDRVFETTATFGGELDYKKFVDFVLAVEFLPQCPRPNFFWNIFDLHGTGELTPMIVNLFHRETHNKLTMAKVMPPPKELVVQEVFDMIPTAQPLRATKKEFCTNPQVGLVCAVLIDCLAFWTYENREHSIAAAQQQ